MGKEGEMCVWGVALPLARGVKSITKKSNYFIVLPKVDQRAGLLIVRRT